MVGGCKIKYGRLLWQRLPSSSSERYIAEGIMSTTPEFIEFVCDQIDARWNKRYRKMFGEYMVYVNDKPILLVCDNTVYAKKLDCIKPFIREEECGFPYDGAKEHYIVDIEDEESLRRIVQELEKVIKVPVKKKKSCSRDN